MSQTGDRYGLMAEYAAAEQLVAAAGAAHRHGYRRLDGYSPFPVPGLAEALGRRSTPVPWIMLGGGCFGGAAGYLLQWWTSAVDYPLNVGGRPLHSWPAFIPITFELIVLCAVLAGVAGLLLLNGLPQPWHPVFNVPAFRAASRDGFFLCIEAEDAAFDPEATLGFLQQTGPVEIHDVRY